MDQGQTITTIVNFPPTTNYFKLIRDILNKLIEKKNHNPISIAEAIDALRKLRKFHKETFIIVFDNVCSCIERLLTSENPSISRECLIIVRDIFSEWWGDNEVGKWIEILLPIVIDISIQTTENTELSLECLNLCANNMFRQETMITLLKGIDSSDNAYAHHSFLTLKSLFINCDKGILEYAFEWEDIFEGLTHIFINPSRRIWLEEIKEIIGAKFTLQEFHDLLSNQEPDMLVNLKEIFNFDYSTVINIKANREYI